MNAISNVNTDIKAIIDWSLENGLLLNSNKTQAIIMGTARYVNAIDLCGIPTVLVEDMSIEYSTSVRYLGVTISNTLS